ncbi:DUF2306 domain-containing protein [Comamonas aquatilis]|uniref:DUF2306 domain-containing protein n=1 Tax=Comamonas aquatilis TaxID=1778406 RepID=UPI0039EFD48A
MTPLIAIHAFCAIGATAIGPVALWARRNGSEARPRMHRAAGYAFVTLMLGAALSALFIRDWRLPNLWGYTPIHLLIPITLVSLALSFWHLAHHRVEQHRRIMRKLYFGACVTAGLFTLLPGRLLGDLLVQSLA